MRAYSAPENRSWLGPKSEGGAGIANVLARVTNRREVVRTPLLELHSEAVRVKSRRLWKRDLKGILLSFTDILNPITGTGSETPVVRDFHWLVDQQKQSDGTPVACRHQGQRRGVAPHILSAVDGAEIELRRVSFRALAEADDPGRHPLDQEWSWRPDVSLDQSFRGPVRHVEAAGG